MKTDRTFLISVHPRWASAFFLSHNPKTIELRKGNFGTSLQAGDTIVIYATLPFGKTIGTVKVVRRELLTVDRLWKESQQGRLAKVSRSQFDDYYASQESGVGVWVSADDLFPSPIARGPTSPELGSALAASAANSAIERRSDGSTEHRTRSHRTRSPTKRYVVMDNLTAWRYQ